MIALVDSVMRAGSDQSMLTDYPLVYRADNLKNVRIIKDAPAVAAQGEPQVVAVVPFICRPIRLAGCDFSIGIISPTATHPDHRHKGYGLACLQGCLEQMAADEIDLSVLWTREATFPFYEHAGYQAVRTQSTLYRCTQADAALFRDYGHLIVVYDGATPHHLSAIMRLHERESAGVVRQADEAAALFALPKMEILLALEGEDVAAYLIVSLASNKFGLIEGGGDERALQTLLHRALTHWRGAAPIPIYGYLTPSVLGDLLERTLPERREPRANHMMIRINQVRPFLEKIKPWLAQKGHGRTDAFSIHLVDVNETIAFIFSKQGLRLGAEPQAQHALLTRQQFTSVLFGEHLARRVSVPAFVAELFPIYFPIWVLDSS
jgi:predicted N-acetyltransferase YhbS